MFYKSVFLYNVARCSLTTVLPEIKNGSNSRHKPNNYFELKRVN